MPILATVILFIFIPLVMMLFRWLRPRLNIQGFLAVLASLFGWILVLLARSDLPAKISLLQWEPVSLFSLSPSLWIDDTSWYFALALTSLSLSVVIISIAQFGQSTQVDPAQSQDPIATVPVNSNAEAIAPSTRPPSAGKLLPGGWLLWASILILTSLGLLAVTAGNLLTLLLAWTALDLVELLILLSQVAQSQARERIILAFSARITGLCLMMIASVLSSSQDATLSFEKIGWPSNILLLLAAGLRLGVLPMHLPYTKGLPINRNLQTVLGLVPAAACFGLLVRLSGIAVPNNISILMLLLVILAGGYASVSWLRSRDVSQARPYWLIATSSLAVASAILGDTRACLIWGLACVLSGGLIFNLSLSHRQLVPWIVLGLINLSGLPFSPTWQAAGLYKFPPVLGISLPLYGVFSISFLIIQAFLFAGYARYAIQGVTPDTQAPHIHVERWVWILYPLSLLVLVLTHLYLGWRINPNFNEIPAFEWIAGPAVLIASVIVFYITSYLPHLSRGSLNPNFKSAWDQLLSLDWLYRFLWSTFRTSSRALGLVSEVLEGDGGLLWALVLFGLIFVFLQRY